MVSCDCHVTSPPPLQGRCGDGAKVSHNYSHRVGEFHSQEALEVSSTLKELRELLAEVSSPLIHF